MTTPPDSESAFTPEPTNQIRQDIDETEGQVIAQMMGGLAIGQLRVYLSHAQTDAESPQPDATNLGDNPYRGLLAFRETDGDRFFGRETQIEQLWQKFCDLHEDESTVRVLPIYGPSGSGKSSLARAGLIPALAKRPLPSRARARLAVLVPGTHPLEALATVLARIATNDPTPVEKSQEFERVLKRKSDEGNYEGLRRIADVLPEIEFSSLIVLVDQFEEVYTYALSSEQTERDAFIAERDAFIENLLCAAAQPTKRVSVILTLRSDFLGDTQQHLRLNKLFSTQGFLVPIMQPEELEIAIAKPAEQAGYKLDKAIVTLLVEQTQGREGALPLLQFALTRIWEGLQNGVDPAETLRNIGGVGGALAGEAQRLYQSLSSEDQVIARSMFLALVQLSEDSADTRRRAPVSELIATDADEIRVRSIINRFAEPGVRFLAKFSDKQHGEMIEVAHEALIRNWGQLKEWLKECREALRKKRKIEQAADEWKYQKKSKDYLLQGRALRDAREFMQAATKETALSSLATEFVKAGVRKQRADLIKSGMFVAIFPSIGTLVLLHFWLVDISEKSLNHPGRNFGVKFFVQYLWVTGHVDYLEKTIDLSYEDLSGAHIPSLRFRSANLSHVDLSSANLRKAFIINTNLQSANLMRADLRGIFLSGGTLSNADFLSANLQGATIKDIDLKDASFERAQLKDAVLENINLKDIRDADKLTTLQLGQAARICNVKLPPHIKLEYSRDCPH